MKPIIRADLDELMCVLAGVQAVQAEAFLNAIKSHERIFLLGKGRSGMVMSMFAMRLMHLGLHAHVVGEATAPALSRGDLLVIGSGSGETGGCLLAANMARSLGVTTVLLSAVAGSTIGSISDLLVVLPCHSKSQAPSSASPLLAGTLFEQALLLFSDCICAQLALDMGRDPASIMDLHTNLE